MTSTINKSWSCFIAGIILGVLLATVIFAVVRDRYSAGGHSWRTHLVLKLGHELDANHPVHLSMLKMSEIMVAKSGGTVEIQVFPSGQLGSETQCIEQLQNGALAMTKASTAPLANFVPDFAIFGVPFLFRDDAHCWRVLDGEIGQSLLNAGRGIGLRGLCFYDAGARSFYTTSKPVLSPDDVVGMKLRVQESKMAMDLVDVLGGSPTPIAFGELYTALQQNMVDGAENNPPSFYANRHYEVCKHLSLDEHTRVPDILLIGETTWQKLSPAVQSWLQEAASESSAYQRKLWQTKTEECLSDLASKGVTIYRPDQSAFAVKVADLVLSYESTALGPLLDRVREEPSQVSSP